MHLLCGALLVVALPRAMAQANPEVELLTNHGRIVVTLDQERAPESVDNFLRYVRAGHYDGTIFHRVIYGFMIQGGGYTPDFRQKPTNRPIRNESINGLRNQVGTLAMARTADPHSATAQFFINLVDNPDLDAPPGKWGYAVFGRVVQGMDVVNAIARVRTGRMPPHENVPVEPVIIEKVRIVQTPRSGN
ncbi:MAG: peptidyl-prolyl cis-trans isomerase [Rhodocyclaceae bacterium]|nr:peptidyl-prolyl cis-trans isomerase [Rhodocyclaceae bacterium]